MTNGFEARKVVRSCRSGALATLERDTASPYVSFCACAFDFAGQPVFLFSDLADHTKNIAQDTRVSFLCEQASMRANPQSGPRVTLVGQMERVSGEECAKTYLQFHPSAQMYAQFADFNFYRLNVEKAHFVGGFGKAVWLDRAEYLTDSAVFLNFSSVQQEINTHLNADFPELARICATKLLGKRGKNWTLLRVDSDGMDLKLASRLARYPFENEVKSLEEVTEIARQICG